MRVTVGMGSCGIAAGASEVFDKLTLGLADRSDCPVTVTGCIGTCYLEPIVNVIDGDNVQTFVHVHDEAADEIIRYAKGQDNKAMDYAMLQEDIDIQNAKQFVALVNCGNIDPESIDDYIARDGYKAIEKCIKEKRNPKRPPAFIFSI